jgi:ABC-type sulfate transport system permease subunit
MEIAEDREMEHLWGEWLVIALNAVMIALILTAPILVGILIMRALRKGINADRQSFEDEILSKLQEIAATQAEIKKRIDELPTR